MAIRIHKVRELYIRFSICMLNRCEVASTILLGSHVDVCCIIGLPWFEYSFFIVGGHLVMDQLNSLTIF